MTTTTLSLRVMHHLSSLESEKRTSNESPHGKVGVEEEADFGSKEIVTGCSDAFKSAGEASPQIGDSGKGADTASATARIEDGPCRQAMR